jgi:chorismate synthase
MNRFGSRLVLEIYGASHADAVGAILSGLPSGLPVDLDRLQSDMNRRRPGHNSLTSTRREPDLVTCSSGITDGITDGTPLDLRIANTDVRSADYDAFKDIPRPGHADFPRWIRSEGEHEYQGSGQSSGRMTAPITAAGAVLRQVLNRKGIDARAQTAAIGNTTAALQDPDIAAERVPLSPVGSADAAAEPGMIREIEDARSAQDSIGGMIHADLTGLPVGVGEPFFNNMEGVIAHLLFSVPAVKGVSFGSGFDLARLRGSEANDPIQLGERNGAPILRSTSNHAGGILGGYSTGQAVTLDVAFKPTATIPREQQSVNLRTGEPTTIRGKGRHDPCIVPRAVVVVEACLLLAAADLLTERFGPEWLRTQD